MTTFDPAKLGDMLQQAQQMAQKLQEDMSRKTAEGQAGGGMVVATVNGHGDLVKLRIEPAVVDKNDVSMLEDLVVAAVNQAHARIREEAGSQMQQQLASVLPPGMF